MTHENKQSSSKDLCKTCKHYWTDFPLPLDHVIAHCDQVDEKYGFKPMDDYVSYPCLKCPFDSYVKKK